MLIIPILLIAVLGILVVVYYNKILWRVISLFSDKKTKKGRIAVWISAIILGVSSCNVFSSFGIFLIHFVIFSLILDGINRLIKIKANFWTRLSKCLIIPILCSGLVFSYGYFNMRNIVRTSYEISSDEIANNYKIIFVSDVHYGTVIHLAQMEELVERLNKENPDVVILGGDIIDESTTKLQLNEVFACFGKIKANNGIYYIGGNHDEQKYSLDPTYSSKEMEDAILKNGISILRDEYIEINDDLLLFGRDDYAGDRLSCEKLLKNADKDKYIIVADHQPVEYNEVEKNGGDLILSGHTHAGQIFPVEYIIKLMGTADLVYGKEKFGNMDAIVSSGAVGWKYPIRTSKHSEYVVVELVKE